MDNKDKAVLVIGGIAGLVAIGIAMSSKSTKATTPIIPPVPGMASLSGTIIGAYDALPVMGVHITLNGYDAFSDVNGRYSFDSIPIGSYILTVQMNNYLAFTTTLDLAGDTTIKNIALTPEVVPPQPPVNALPFSYSNISYNIDIFTSPENKTFYFVHYMALVTNNNNTPVTNSVSMWLRTYDWFLQDSEPITLEPGQSYQYDYGYSINPDTGDIIRGLMIFPGVIYGYQLRDSGGGESPVVMVSL
jgi:hypothetical protein